MEPFKLDENVLTRMGEDEKKLFIYEWLCNLHKSLHTADKSLIRNEQQTLVERLMALLGASSSPGPPTRRIVGCCLALLFTHGDTFSLFDCVNCCNDAVRSSHLHQTDAASALAAISYRRQLTRLGAIGALANMYARLGRMMGRSYEETLQVLLKVYKSNDLQTRLEILSCIHSLLVGVGPTATQPYHRDISKMMKTCLADRVLLIRESAADTLCRIPVTGSELEVVLTLALRLFEGADYRTRLAGANLIASAFSNAVKARQRTLEECLQLLSTAFVRGNLGSLFKGADGLRAGIRETRAGLAHAYVFFMEKMGGLFVERNLKQIMMHLIESLASVSKNGQSHLDSVFSRTCTLFILRSVFSDVLSDKAQRSACRHLGHILLRQLNQKSGPNSLICIFEVVSMLVLSLESTLNSVVQDSSVGLVEITFSALTNSNSTVRIYAAYLLRWITQAQPALLSPIMQRCIDQFEVMKTSPSCIAGYSCAIAAMLSSSDVTLSQLTNLRKYKLIFSISEEMLRSAKDDANVALLRAQKGWLIMGSIMGLGPSTVRSLLPRLLLLWKSSFPRTQKDFALEKSRGDLVTWECVLENRAGALATMSSFLKHCREIASEDILWRLLSPIESALFMVSNLSDVIRQFGQQLKAGAAMVRFRLYQVLLQIPPLMFESSFSTLIKLVVIDVTLSDHGQSTTTTSRLQIKYLEINKFHAKDEHKMIEESVYADGALEHDLTYLYRKCDHNIQRKPLPLGIGLIDAAVDLFGYIFPHVSDKHRQQIVLHFSDCVRHNGRRVESLYINIFASLFAAVKFLVKSLLNVQSDVAQAIIDLALPGLNSQNETVRHAAAEVLGYTVVASNNLQIATDLWFKLIDTLRTVKDCVSRSGHALALGYLHRYTAGYMSDSQHFSASLKMLLMMAQDSSSSLSQSWALFGLNLLSYSGSSLRPHVDLTLSVVLRLMLSSSSYNTIIHQNLGRCLQTLIGTLGPELQTLTGVTRNLQIGCRLLQNHPDPVVKSEALGALQQLHLFAPNDISIAPILSFLCGSLESEHVALRHAAIACLRQFLQREPLDIFQRIAENPPQPESVDVSNYEDEFSRGLPWERGLILVAFCIMDIETERRAVSHLRDILVSLLSLSYLTDWLSICKQVLADTSSDDVEEAGDGKTGITCNTYSVVGLTAGCANGTGLSVNPAVAGCDDGDTEDVEQQFQRASEPDSHPSVGPRWRTKVFAVECVIHLVQLCDGDKTHFDMSLARKAQASLQLAGNRQSFLILHLPELIRMAFMACTSDAIQLTVSGLKLLQMIIDRFADIPEPEFDGHMILEQYQAQVDAALRPAFTAGDTPSEIIALACQVCSTWMCSSVSNNLSAVQRVHTLLANSLHKVMARPSAKGELSTLEIVSVLKAWAEVYIRGKTANSSLLTLIEADIYHLSQYWLAFIKDYAMLGLPSSLFSQLPHDGGAFFTPEVAEHCRRYYKESWSPILYAACLWLCKEGGFEVLDKRSTEDCEVPHSFLLPKSERSLIKRWLFLLYAVCSEALYNRTEHALSTLQCLNHLVKFNGSYVDISTGIRGILELECLIELISILQRTLIAENQTACRLQVLEIAHEIARQLPDETTGTCDLAGSVYSLLNLALCTAVIHCPSVSKKLSSVVPRIENKILDSCDLQKAVVLLTEIPELLKPKLAVELVPSLLHINLTLLLEGFVGGCILQSLRRVCSLRIFDICVSLKTAHIRNLTAALHYLLQGISDNSAAMSSTWGPSLLLAVAIFVCAAPAAVTVDVPSVEERVLELFERSLVSESLSIVKTAVSCVRNILLLTKRPIYILKLSEKVYSVLLSIKDSSVVLECIACLQTIVDIASVEHKMCVLKILVTILLSLAVEKTLSTEVVVDVFTRNLSAYNVDLKKILAESPALKHQLETIVKLRRQEQSANLEGVGVSSEPDLILKQPTIQLKNDFSNFIVK